MNSRNKLVLVISILLVFTMLGTVGAFAENFTELTGVKLIEDGKVSSEVLSGSTDIPLDATFKLNFSNGIYRVFNENENKIELYNVDNNNEKIDIELQIVKSDAYGDLVNKEDNKQNKDDKNQGNKNKGNKEDKNKEGQNLEAEGLEKSQSIALRPVEALQEGTKYQIVVHKDFKANNGATLKEDIHIGFTTMSLDKVVEVPFIDIADSSEKEAIESMFKRGYIHGKSETHFAPNENITRAEIATIMCRILELNEKEDISEYKDIKADEWYSEYIAKALKAEIIEAKDSMVRPNDNITKEEFKAIAYNGYKHMGKDIDNTLDFETKENVTRAEATAILNNLVNTIEK